MDSVDLVKRFAQSRVDVLYKISGPLRTAQKGAQKWNTIERKTEMIAVGPED